MAQKIRSQDVILGYGRNHYNGIVEFSVGGSEDESRRIVFNPDATEPGDSPIFFASSSAIGSNRIFFTTSDLSLDSFFAMYPAIASRLARGSFLESIIELKSLSRAVAPGNRS